MNNICIGKKYSKMNEHELKRRYYEYSMSQAIGAKIASFEEWAQGMLENEKATVSNEALALKINDHLKECDDHLKLLEEYWRQSVLFAKMVGQIYEVLNKPVMFSVERNKMSAPELNQYTIVFNQNDDPFIKLEEIKKIIEGIYI